MAKNPASDYGRDLGKLEGGVDVLKNLTFTVIGFLFAIGGGGIFLLTQIYDLKSSLGETKQNVASALERIGKIENAASTIEGAVAELRGGQVAASDALSRIENSIAAAIGGPTSPLQPIATQLLISLDDAQTIRAALKSDPDQAYKNVGKLGDEIAEGGLSMKTGSAKTVRCAIYTRVSTDQGLEQDFNSLDAQYDASQAYIRSQAHFAAPPSKPIFGNRMPRKEHTKVTGWKPA